MPAKSKITLGSRFGKLVVVRLTDKRLRGEYVWECLCDCGNLAYRTTSKLKLAIGCGCMVGKHVQHGMSDTPELIAWWSMQNRCYNTHNASYDHYGAKGVMVAPEWLGREGFKRFLAHVGLRPTVNHSLDRYPNKDGDYAPNNVRWATRSEQQRNRGNNRVLTLNGVSKTLVEWSEMTGIHRATITTRLKNGMSVEDALTRRVRTYTKWVR